MLAKNPLSISAVITALSRLYQKRIEKTLQADLVLSDHPLLTVLAGEVKNVHPYLYRFTV
ncbi:hypothetical protein [Alteribacillus bidgolensis]|uniref:Uncharacterized protein n=1 Tax=Alteribacillus bidgolensis TaxID=930129 RepID=A0A1G8J5D4_9BACI|nr:hypothetical protein [Alteribacillus bidgolensis]SDI26485.1 hypothetical protein SAMN05216352_10652 [Alteribacillus bidgolensis]